MILTLFSLFLLRLSDQLGLQVVSIDRAISTGEAAMLHISDHNHKPLFLGILSSSFLRRFQRLRDPVDLEKATPIMNEAVDGTLAAAPEREPHLTLLCGMCAIRLCQLDQSTDLNESIAMLEEAAESFSGDVSSRIRALTLLHLGNTIDLKRLIAAGEKAVALSPIGDPMLPGLLVTLGPW